MDGNNVSATRPLVIVSGQSTRADPAGGNACLPHLWLAGLLLVASLSAARSVATAQETSTIEVMLTANQETYRRGEPILLRATVRNSTTRDMLLVRPQDGSDRAWQYPLGFFELKNAQGQRLEQYVPRCKTMDPLPTSAFFTLRRGATAELYPQGHNLTLIYVIDRPGVYFVTYRYSTVTSQEWQWYGAYSDDYWRERLANEFWRQHEPTVLANRRLLEKIERCSVRSNTLRFEIAPSAASKEDALVIAREVCASQGWPWQDPAIVERDRYWEVTTKRFTLGGNAYLRIDKATGAVEEKHLTGP